MNKEEIIEQLNNILVDLKYLQEKLPSEREIFIHRILLGTFISILIIILLLLPFWNN